MVVTQYGGHTRCLKPFDVFVVHFQSINQLIHLLSVYSWPRWYQIFPSGYLSYYFCQKFSFTISISYQTGYLVTRCPSRLLGDPSKLPELVPTWLLCLAQCNFQAFTYFINFISLSHLKSFKSILSHEQEITSLQELSFGVLPVTSRNVLVKQFFNFQTEEQMENNF